MSTPSTIKPYGSKRRIDLLPFMSTSQLQVVSYIDYTKNVKSSGLCNYSERLDLRASFPFSIYRFNLNRLDTSIILSVV